MEPVNTSGVSVQSTLGGQEFKMGIDESAMAHIMSVLTDLYGDPELAVIREYSTNAWDAHVEAGVTRPIEVETPTPLRQLLVIRDFGIGLSVDDIHNIYSRYGASTKRGTNTQTGMLGLGCKSALTYTHQFTLVSNKDGVKSQVSISRDDTGGGSMTVVDTSSTTDSNGTEIWIPVKAGNTVEKKAQDFFRYWPADRVLLNGKPPARLEGLRIGKDFVVLDDASLVGEHKLVMGGVPYPTDALGGLVTAGSVVAFVPIGDLVFTPSREGLQDVQRTQETIKRVREQFIKDANGAIQSAINDCKTHRDAVRAMLKWHKVLPAASRADVYTFKGEDLPTRVAPTERQLLVRHNSYKQHQHDEVEDLDMGIYIDAVWIHGYDRPNFTVGQKKKIVQWATERYEKRKIELPRNYILQMSQPDLRYVDKDNVVDWDEIRQIVLPRATTNYYGVPARITGSFDVYIDGDFHSQKLADSLKISKSRPMFYHVGNRWSAANYSKLLNHFHKQFTLVMMPANREAKFKRDFPKAQNAHDSARALYTKWLATWSKDHRTAMAAHDSGYALMRVFSELDPKRVNDPALKEATRLPAIDLTKMLEQRSLYQTTLGIRIGSDVKWTNPLANYPLFEVGQLRNYKNHVYIYLNAAYAAATKGA